MVCDQIVFGQGPIACNFPPLDFFSPHPVHLSLAVSLFAFNESIESVAPFGVSSSLSDLAH
jgi:hypothetical protein